MEIMVKGGLVVFILFLISGLIACCILLVQEKKGIPGTSAVIMNTNSQILKTIPITETIFEAYELDYRAGTIDANLYGAVMELQQTVEQREETNTVGFKWILYPHWKAHKEAVMQQQEEKQEQLRAFIKLLEQHPQAPAYRRTKAQRERMQRLLSEMIIR